MKRKTLPAIACMASLCLLLTFIISGCLKDHCTKKYTYYIPVYKTTAQVRADIKSNPIRDIALPGKIYVSGHYIFLNEKNKGIHIIDNTNPSSPQNVAFIDIPGNIDMAVKGHTLYADSYTDLVTIDITDPLQAKAVKFTENVFPYTGCGVYYNTDSAQVVVDWIKSDTTIDVDCGKNEMRFFFLTDKGAMESMTYSSASNSTPFAMGGSMARFAIASQYLYTVTYNALNVFGINAPKDPSFEKKIEMGNTWNIETIFPFQNKLFIGSSTGMFVYNIDNGANPEKESQFEHVRSCDPVIADSKYAYVTLRSGTTCQGFSNQLEVMDISNINSPKLLKTYPMTNPHGLSKDGNLLFICDGTDGMKVYNAADVNNIQLLSTISGLETYDVIANNKVALLVTSDGLYQYDYSNPSSLKLLSKIILQK